MPLELTDKATALEYEALTSTDQWMEIPPDRKNECKCKAYKGWLSNITEHAAERYVKSGGNLIRKKVTPVQKIEIPDQENENDSKLLISE